MLGLAEGSFAIHPGHIFAVGAGVLIGIVRIILEAEAKVESMGMIVKKKKFLCSFCHKAGHTKKFCYRLKRKSPRKSRQFVNFIDSPKPSTSNSSDLFKRLKVDLNKSDTDDEDIHCMMVSARSKTNAPCYVEAMIDKKRLSMEVDCGSAESVVSESLFLRNFRKCHLEKCNRKLYVIDGNRLNILGKAKVSVELNGILSDQYLIVLQGANDFVPLMGRSWLDVFFEGWRRTFVDPIMPIHRINAVMEDVTREEVINDVKHIFAGKNCVCAQTSSQDPRGLSPKIYSTLCF